MKQKRFNNVVAVVFIVVILAGGGYWYVSKERGGTVKQQLEMEQIENETAEVDKESVVTNNDAPFMVQGPGIYRDERARFEVDFSDKVAVSSEQLGKVVFSSENGSSFNLNVRETELITTEHQGWRGDLWYDKENSEFVYYYEYIQNQKECPGNFFGRNDVKEYSRHFGEGWDAWRNHQTFLNNGFAVIVQYTLGYTPDETSSYGADIMRKTKATEALASEVMSTIKLDKDVSDLDPIRCTNTLPKILQFTG